MKYKILTIILLTGFLFGCEDYLDLVPEKDIETTESIFEKRNTALNFFKGNYARACEGHGDFGGDPAMCGADEFITGQYLRTAGREKPDYITSFKIAEGLQNSSIPFLPEWGMNTGVLEMYANTYYTIRNCNIFLDNVDRVYDMSDEEKARFKAESNALKAFYYFQLVKRYGPIVLVPSNFSVSDDIEVIRQPRSHVDTCFNRIVELLDESIPYLKTISELTNAEYGSITKEAAYTLKAKTLLYSASPLFNGNGWYGNFTNVEGEPLFSKSYDDTKWEKAAKAIDEAIDYCEGHGRELYTYPGTTETNKTKIVRDIQYSVIPALFNSKELIWGFWSMDYRDFYLKLPRYNSQTGDYNSQILGNVNPTMRMVELFYTENGLPIDMDKDWKYNNRYQMGIENDASYKNLIVISKPVLNLHTKREPRFYADIAFDKGFWTRGNENIEMKPYKGDDHGTELDRVSISGMQNISGYWVKKLVPKEIVGRKYEYSFDYQFPYPKFRMAELYLMQAEAWNEVAGPSAKVYNAINIIRRRAGIPDVQDAWQNYSTNPEKVTTKEGLREIIHQETSIEFAFEGHRFWDLRRWKEAHIYQNKPIEGWNIFGENSKEFYNNYNGPIVIWDKNRFEIPRDYFWPIHDKEVLKSNIKQNLGW